MGDKLVSSAPVAEVQRQTPLFSMPGLSRMAQEKRSKLMNILIEKDILIKVVPLYTW
jgi:hypothetical protein